MGFWSFQTVLPKFPIALLLFALHVPLYFSCFLGHVSFLLFMFSEPCFLLLFMLPGHASFYFSCFLSHASRTMLLLLFILPGPCFLLLFMLSIGHASFYFLLFMLPASCFLLYASLYFILFMLHASYFLLHASLFSNNNCSLALWSLIFKVKKELFVTHTDTHTYITVGELMSKVDTLFKMKFRNKYHTGNTRIYVVQLLVYVNGRR